MSEMNIEVMEQLLKDLAANVGYDLIPAPFDTPFAEASIEGLPDSKQFFWPMPASVLNDKEHEEFRKMCVEADIIDTVCTTSYSWPTDENDHVAILLIDVTRRRRGCIKFVYANDWDISKDSEMAGVCNMLIHDLFPGEDLLAFQMDENQMDLELDYPWNHQVCILAVRDVNSLFPSDYLYKPGYGKYDEEVPYLVGNVFDISCPIDAKDIAELKTPAILLSTIGKLCPQIVNSQEDLQGIALSDKMLLIPEKENIHMDFALQLFCSEEVIRQLPISRRITMDDMWRVQFENNGLITISEDDERVIEVLAKLIAKSKGKSDKS